VTGWWRDAVVYQVYLRSFADASGDGVGDLAGARSRLGYLAELGVDAVWLNPFYPSPGRDHGYDVADYCGVDSLLGTLEEFDGLVAAAHRLGLRVLVDLVPNHTSSEHPWFRRALADPTSPYRDYYVFRPPRPDGGPPNNWQSVFGGPAWTADPASAEHYLHLFDSGQPDLNWHNPRVHAEFEAILQFWLDRGADGFRIDVAHGLYKRGDLADDPPGGPRDQPEVVDVYRRWREIVDSAGDRVLVGEMFLRDFDVAAASRYVGAQGLHQAFNFKLTFAAFDADEWAGILSESLKAFDVPGAAPAWVLSNHDVVRHPTRYGPGRLGRRRARAATAMLLALPGTTYLYQGEELGLPEATVRPAARQDPIWRRSGGRVIGRDGCRTPIPWTLERPGLGFSTGQPWLPFGRGAAALAVEVQEADPQSTLTFYRRALSLRRTLRGDLLPGATLLPSPRGILAVQRARLAGGSLLAVMNTGSRPRQFQLPVPDPGLLLATTGGAEVRRGAVRVPADCTVWLLG
jgi:alpha-glucosidase